MPSQEAAQGRVRRLGRAIVASVVMSFVCQSQRGRGGCERGPRTGDDGSPEELPSCYDGCRHAERIGARCIAG